MKRWYDTQIGVPLSHAAATNRLSMTANFAGNTALQASPYDRLPATAFFAGASSFIADLTGRIIPATAAFSATSVLAFAAPYKQLIAAATFAGASTASATARMAQAANANYAASTSLSASMLLWRRWTAVANFAGASTLSANLTLVGRLQATATWAAAGAMAPIISRQRMQAVAKFAANSQFSYTPRMRMAAIARFAGAGIYSATGNVVTPASVSPNPPSIVLLSTAEDTTPDFTAALPHGAGNQTDAQTSDILVLEYTSNFADVPPNVISVSPPTGLLAGGTAVTIAGTKFTGATGVTFGGVTATSIVVVNDTTITCVTPAGSGPASVAVTIPVAGTGIGFNLFTFATSVGWQVAKLGAGGFVSGIDAHADGTKVIRCDTYGGWVWDPNAPSSGNAGGLGNWKQLCTVTSLPPADVGLFIVKAIYEVVIAPSDSTRLYMHMRGYVFRSDDRGAHWTRTAFTRNDFFDGSTIDRAFGPYMAVDPVNKDICYVGAPNGAAQFTINAGASWTPVPNVVNPTGMPGNAGHFPCFDKSSATVAGRKSTIYVGSYGRGVYRSTDSGASFSLLAGGPTTFHSMICASDGVLWACDNAGTTTGAWKYQSGAWTHFTSLNAYQQTGNINGQWVHAVPDMGGVAGRVFLLDELGQFAYTANNGTSWVNPILVVGSAGWVGSDIATDVPWIDNDQYNNNGQLEGSYCAKLNPGTNEIWATSGSGVWKTTPPTTDTGYVWNSVNAGIEQLVALQILNPPNYAPLALVADKQIFRFNDLTKYPDRHGAAMPAVGQILHCRGGAWASANPNTIVVSCQYLDDWNDWSSYSNDGGATWSLWPTRPPNTPSQYKAGGMAAASTTNWVWIPVPSTPTVWYTLNAGNNWLAAAGLPSGAGWGGEAYQNNRHIVCADRDVVNHPNTFYAFNFDNGIYRSTNGGANWTLLHAAAPFNAGQFGGQALLKSVPNFGSAAIGGHLFLSPGYHGDEVNGFFAEPLYRSTDGGTNWAAVPNTSAWCHGFGKAAAGQSYPAVYFAGWLSGDYGIWKSIDNCVNWTKISTWALDYPLPIIDIEGDANISGRVYVAFQTGVGFAYIDT